MKRLAFSLACAALLGAPSGPAGACAPAPSCWMEEGFKKHNIEYLCSVCAGYAKNNATQRQIAHYVEEPGKVADFAKACARLGVHIKP